MEMYAEPEGTAADVTEEAIAHEEGTSSPEQVLEEFVRPFYSSRDTLHGLPHLRRIAKKARYLARQHTGSVDALVLLHSAYLHGLIFQEELRIRRFLQSRQLDLTRIEHIMRAACEAHMEPPDGAAGEGDRMAVDDSLPMTLEGIIVHDAQLLEGGRTFLIASSLMLGAAQGATLEEVLATVEEQMLGCIRCYLPEAQRLYAEKTAFARAFLDDLIPQL